MTIPFNETASEDTNPQACKLEINATEHINRCCEVVGGQNITPNPQQMNINHEEIETTSSEFDDDDGGIKLDFCSKA